MGGIVRSTGSGMGCPDWPTCFGQVIPPTSVDQLPENYKEVYSEYRHQKNVKFARYLEFLNLNDAAQQLLNDPSVREEADFNVAKTWVEYVNRLIGVVIGLFIIALAWRSFQFRKNKPRLFFISALTLITVIIQGWFGSIVVSSNLTTWTITIHMFLALVIVAMLIYLLQISSTETSENRIIQGSQPLKWLLIACVILLLMQTFLGTEVRSAIDRIANTVIPRNRWIEGIGSSFLIHRSFSWLVLGSHVILFYLLRKSTQNKALPLALIILILGAILTGTGMAYFGIPAFLQPLHLVIATLTFGLQLYVYFSLNTGGKLMFNKTA